jgi:glutamine cyclotransferase
VGASRLRHLSASMGVTFAMVMSLLGLPAHPADSVAPVWQHEVVAVYPHDPNAYTQGLVYADGYLYESTGQYGESELRRVELETGRVLASHELDDRLFGEGLAKVQDRLFQLTWRSQVCLVYAVDGLKPLAYFRYQGQGWGLARYGEHLLMSNGSSRISVRDPENFSTVRDINVQHHQRPVTRLNELEIIEGRIWANVWLTSRIAIIQPDTGAVTAWLDLSDLQSQQTGNAEVLNGIAYDAEGGRIFVTGKYWPRLYQIRVPPTSASKSRLRTGERSSAPLLQGFPGSKPSRDR